MRIVIEIDPPAVSQEAGLRPQAPIVCVGNAATESVESVANPAATTGAADPMNMNAGGERPMEVADTAATVPPELLARAASLNAFNAGPAPGFTANAPTRTAVTQEDRSESLLTRAGEDSPILARGLESVLDGGITSAGPAPKQPPRGCAQRGN